MVYSISYGQQIYMNDDEFRKEIVKVLTFIDVNDNPTSLLKKAAENVGETIVAYTSKKEPVLIQAFSFS